MSDITMSKLETELNINDKGNVIRLLCAMGRISLAEVAKRLTITYGTLWKIVNTQGYETDLNHEYANKAITYLKNLTRTHNALILIEPKVKPVIKLEEPVVEQTPTQLTFDNITASKPVQPNYNIQIVEERPTVMPIKGFRMRVNHESTYVIIDVSKGMNSTAGTARVSFERFFCSNNKSNHDFKLTLTKEELNQLGLHLMQLAENM